MSGSFNPFMDSPEFSMPAVPTTRSARPGERVRPVTTFSPEAQANLRHLFEFGEVPKILVGDQVCVSYNDLSEYMTSDYNPDDWDQYYITA